MKNLKINQLSYLSAGTDPVCTSTLVAAGASLLFGNPFAAIALTAGYFIAGCHN